MTPAVSDAVAEAARRSPLVEGPAFSEHADADELRFREEIEPGLAGDVAGLGAGLDRKELVARLEYVLRRAGIAPHGVVVELGAGACWLAGVLARSPEVERVVAVEFSRHRLVDLAPVALAHVGAPAEKVERRLADFYASGLPAGEADLVVTDAAYHHAADPVALGRVAFDLLRPGGTLLLFREPTLSLLRRSRDRGIEEEYGGFEHDYSAREYLRQLGEAGFAERRKVAAPSSFVQAPARWTLRPPLSWLNGIAFAEYAYVARKPA